MLIKGVAEELIEKCAASLGMRFKVTGQRGRYVRGVLRIAKPLGGRPGHRPEGATKYRKRAYGRYAFGTGPEYAQGAVCFHGHRDFMRLLFGLNREAIILTTMSAYRGLDGFTANFPAVGDRNIGSQMYPLRYGDACDCDDDGHEVQFGTLLPPDHEGGEARLVGVRHIRHSDLRRCPFFILAPEHYREDGTCKCNDPVERERMKKEWDYTDEAFREKGLIA